MDISGKIENQVIVDLLAHIRSVAAELEVPFFLVGATARDLVLSCGFGVREVRATRDTDIGVRVTSWQQYNLLKSALVKTGLFEPQGNGQRMRFKSELIVDLVPFGEIVDSEYKVFWGPDDDLQLSLMGFDEAFEQAIDVTICRDPRLDVKIASPAGLVLLKIFAWDDRRPETKDAIDLGVLIRNYLTAGNEPRLFHEHDDLLNRDDFDYEVAGAHILGRDIAAMCGRDLRQRILAILDRELSEEGDLPLVVESAATSPQINRSLEFWTAIQYELRAATES